MNPSRAFTAKEDARLRHLREQGLAMSEIASAMGRTPASVKQRVHHLRMPPVQAPKYTPAEDGYLTELWLIGYQAAQIGQMLERKFGIPRSTHSVQNRRELLKLPARQKGYRPPAVLRPKKEVAAAAPQPIVVKPALDFVQFSKERRREELERAAKHAARVAGLPPLTKEDAAQLVAIALAAGKVTRCPAKVVAPINGGHGL